MKIVADKYLLPLKEKDKNGCFVNTDVLIILAWLWPSCSVLQNISAIL